MVAMLFGALDGTIVGTAIPRIVGELNGLNLVTWLTTAYMLCSTTVVPIAGKLSDLIGRKSVYLVGLSVFIIGSALCGVAQSIHQLIWFRGLQGIGGGIIMPMAIIIIGDIFTGEERVKWQGAFGAIFGLSSLIGPQIGGWIVDAMSWRWVFYINLPVGLIAMLLISIGLKKHKVSAPVKLDIGGAITLILGVSSLLLALTFGGNEWAWDSIQISTLFVISILTLIGFVFIEMRASEPILPLQLFKNKTLPLLSGIGFFMSVGMFGATMFVPLFMQSIIGVSPSESGAIMTPMMIAMVLTSITGGRIVRKADCLNILIIIGMAIIVIGFWLLSTLGIHTSKWIAMRYMMILGLGIGLVLPLINIALQETFPKSQLGVVTSSSQFFRQIGGTFGITVLGAIMNHQSTHFLNQQLLPRLTGIATPHGNNLVQKIEFMIKTHPQNLYSMLLNPEALQKIPLKFQQAIIPVIKNTFIDSLHSVFLFGLILVSVGLVLTPFLDKIKIIKRNSEKSISNSLGNPSMHSKHII